MKKLIRITTVPLSLDKLLGEQLRFMNRHFKVTAVSADPDELKRVAEKYGVGHFHVEMTREITPLQDLKALLKLYLYLKKEQPEMVHSHTPKAGIIGMLAARLAGVPVRLHTVAGMPLMEASGTKRKILDFVEKLTYAAATKVYPNSKGLYDFIIQNQYARPDKLKVIANGSSNGIDTAWFSPDQIAEVHKQQLREDLQIDKDDFVFIFVGRLVGDKGINELVTAFRKMVSVPAASAPLSHRTEAIPKLHNLPIPDGPTTPNQQTTPQLNDFTAQRLNDSTTPQLHNSTFDSPVAERSRSAPSIKLLLVGPLETALDPLNPETLQEIERNPDIITVGYQQDVRPYFAISNALVFPSYREGFPNVVMQAGAMGLPAIVTDINGCNEIIIEGENGTIIPAKEANALQEAMLRMIEDREWYVRLQQKARSMITSRYEQQVVWDALLEEYRRLLPE